MNMIWKIFYKNQDFQM